jgi:hypothetical protein
MNIFNEHEMGNITAEIGLFEYPNGASFTGTNPLAETPIGMLGPGPYQIAIGSVMIHPQLALTANDSNYATITVSKRTAGGAPVTIASCTTKTLGGGGTGNWTAFAPVAMTVAANAFISPNDTITITIGKTGTGVTVPPFYLAGYPTVN